MSAKTWWMNKPFVPDLEDFPLLHNPSGQILLQRKHSKISLFSVGREPLVLFILFLSGKEKVYWNVTSFKKHNRRNVNIASSVPFVLPFTKIVLCRSTFSRTLLSFAAEHSADWQYVLFCLLLLHSVSNKHIKYVCTMYSISERLFKGRIVVYLAWREW